MTFAEWGFAGLGALASVYTIISYYSSKSVSETRTIALEKFDFLKRINDELLNDLIYYGKQHNSFLEIFMQGFTLQQFIDLLKKMQIDALSSEHRAGLEKSKSKIRIEEIIKHFDTQVKHHMEVRTTFDYFINRSR